VNKAVVQLWQQLYRATKSSARAVHRQASSVSAEEVAELWYARSEALFNSISSEWDVGNWVPGKRHELQNAEEYAQSTIMPLKNKMFLRLEIRAPIILKLRQPVSNMGCYALR